MAAEARDVLTKGISKLRQLDLSAYIQQQCSDLENLIKQENLSYKDVFKVLYLLLLKPQYTTTITKCFPNTILQILNENISLKKDEYEQNNINCDIEKQQLHIENCVVLAKLIRHSNILQFAFQYFDLYPSPFEWESDIRCYLKKRKTSLTTNTITDVEIVESCHRFLNVAPNVFRTKWKWSKFIDRFIQSEDNQIKWLMCQCISILTGMSELQTNKLKNNLISDSQISRKLLLKYSDSKDYENYFNSTDLSVENINILSDFVIDVSGILLPVNDASNKQDGFLVNVKSTLDNLRSLALAIVSGKAVCLTGPVGCGKTALVEHLACLTGRKDTCLKKVQLGDQTDSRSLLGTYRCTDVPGEFVWQPGVLTQAVQQGHWLLLEDIDCAAIDVASVLSSLLERNVLSVPGYRDSIPIVPGFQLFVTKRTVSSITGNYKQNSNTSILLEKNLIQINVEPLSRSELITVVEVLFPQLKTISSRMIDVFMLFSSGSHHSSLQTSENDENISPLVKTLPIMYNSELLSLKTGRLTSTRDLLKWCSRAIIDFNISSAESALKVLQDAIDIFACSLPDNESRILFATTIGAFLGIVENKSEYYCTTYKPSITLNPNSLLIGRAKVPRKQLSLDSINFKERKVTFSYTRPSLCLLERIACCVNMNEPVLLVGETGTGKTSSVQYLAKETGHKLIVINMNQQSDSADLLGGYKPVDLKYIISPIKNEFEHLFRNYFDGVKNAKFLEHISNTFYASDWKILMVLMKQSQEAAVHRLKMTIGKEVKGIASHKNDEDYKLKMFKSWKNFGKKLDKLELQIKSQASLAFSFIEGSLVNALKEGHWVLLDEINLASAETLECLSGLLEGQNNSISLIERGDDCAVERHKDFTLFACMNPATDVGKKDLPAGLRNRFTEFFVDELSDRNDFLLLIGDYIRNMGVESSIIESIYKFYLSIRKESKLTLMDGTGQSPHYSLRTLCRALTAAPTAYCGTVTRSLYETMCLSFLTQLDSTSHPKVQGMIASAVLGKKSLKSITQQPIPEPNKKDEIFLNFEGYWICQGKLEPNIPNDYVLTHSIRKNLRDLVRIISLGKLPILLQGDTSVGKTSLITYLAKASGNYCVRINNHQHTDLQEYVGSYATDSSGKLVFKEGVLVEAMRKGYWIILDELNLAPSDVLEALNRVLDDNKELFIPETQQTVKADPKFILFATQNPPGLYGGRKLLSRAFRNRFVELHFDEIPKSELEVILHQRCDMPLSYCKKVLAVMTELQVRRRGSAAVQGKEGFITLRDLFRWGERYKIASNRDTLIGKYYDWDQHIADEGYLVLAGKVRQPEERSIIQEVLQKHIKREVNPNNLFSLHENTSSVTRTILESILNIQIDNFKHLVWTFNMRRLAVLVAKAFLFKEPVLLVGETGCGKTTVCQVLAAIRNCLLTSVNCHMHTESSDFLGGLRPVRHHTDDGKLFEWVDGPLVETMKSGGIFLSDEISLADDSVLERLNSLLEPERQILLAEKGISMEDDLSYVVTAAEDFRFIGTMNPGGDYGKKELSPALRNRFTEIWCDHIIHREDLIAVLKKSLNNDVIEKLDSFDICASIFDFVQWFKKTKIGERFPCSIRDLLSWIHFINEAVINRNISICEAYLHGAGLVFLDSLGSSISGSESDSELHKMKEEAVALLMKQINIADLKDVDYVSSLLLSKSDSKLLAVKKEDMFGIEPFFIECGNVDLTDKNESFNFMAPTTGLNTLRILRGLQLNKAILLEGSPGVGKTSLVTALAKTSGHRVLRINLSDQTDISDLFGADLPTADGSFAWREGAFLTALQNGDWILLDELNLAPQPVLEGLNACLDHRGEIFIPELNKTFVVKIETRIFACQNPLQQGGARRGLPKSFLNRFTQVYIDTLSSQDLLFITHSQFPLIPQDLLSKMIQFNAQILHETSNYMWGYKGSPWELNLRDIQRWCEGIMRDDISEAYKKYIPGKIAQILYVDRMRTIEDKNQVKTIYESIFKDYPLSDNLSTFYITHEDIHIGNASMKRNTDGVNKNMFIDKKMLVLRNQLPVLKSLMQCINMNWLSIIVGPTASGKSSCVQVISQLAGSDLKILPVTSAMDTADILGGFEQADYNRHLEVASNKIEEMLLLSAQKSLSKTSFNEMSCLLHEWEIFKFLDDEVSNEKRTIALETKHYMNKLNQLKKVTENLSMLHSNDEFIKIDLLNIQNQLQEIERVLEKDQSINAGGRFEWIDSLLIKCLLDGSWLLIDNVNFCSSAVLDRLNCLLEPNGALNIPERGDSLSDIRPHPNFRMFFTMDPKNGEISRAMRNRGVEIYIVGPEDYSNELITSTIPLLDLQALLSSTGLPDSLHPVFLSNHEHLCSFIQGYEKPSQCHLLQAAFLTCQQLTRGVSIQSAIVNSFSDVYIKSRTSSDFIGYNKTIAEHKNIMLRDLIENVTKYSSNEEILSLDLLPSHTFSCRSLTNCVQLSRIKQESYFLYLLLKKYSMEQFDYKDSLNISAMFYNLYHQSASVDNSLKHDCIDNMLSNVRFASESDLSWCKSLNNNLYAAMNTFKIDEDDYPWDSKLLPEVYKLNKSNSSAVNKLCGYLYFMTTSAQRKFLSSDSDCITMMNYSKNVLNERLCDDHSDFPLLKHCSELIVKCDGLIKIILQHPKTELTDETWSDKITRLGWLNRFYKVCYLPLFETVTAGSKKRQIIKEESLKSLLLHYKWLIKYFYRQLIKDYKDPHVLIRNMDMLMMKIDNSILTSKSPFKSICKRMNKILGQPSLYPNNAVYSLCAFRNNYISNHVSIKFLNRNFGSSDIELISINTANIERQYLLSIKNMFDYPDGDFHIKTDLINDQLKKSQSEIVIDTNVNNNANNTFDYESKLWPIKDYIMQKVVNLYKNRLFMNFLESSKRSCDYKITKNTSDYLHYKKILTHLANNIDKLNFCPPKLSCLISNWLLSIEDDSNKDLISLSEHSLEIWNLISEYNDNSPTTNTSYWLNWKVQMLEMDETDYNQVEYEPMAYNFPYVTYNTIKLILNSNSDKDMLTPAPLFGWQQRSKQLANLHHLLCRNTAITCSSNFYSVLQNVQTLLINFERFVICLDNILFKKIVKINESFSLIAQNDQSVPNIVERTICLLNKLYEIEDIDFSPEMINFKDDFITWIKKCSIMYSYLNNRINSGCIKDEDLDDISFRMASMWTLFSMCNIVIFSDINTIDVVKKDEFKIKYMMEDINMIECLLEVKLLQKIVQGNIYIKNSDLKAIFNWKSDDIINDVEVNISGLYEKLSDGHPHDDSLLDKRRVVKDNLEKLSNARSYRPTEPNYDDLTKEFSYFVNSIGNSKIIMEHYQNMVEVQNQLQHILKSDKSVLNIPNLLQQANDVVKRFSMWKYSMKNFYAKTSKKFSEVFPDVMTPFLNCITQLLYGLNLLKDSLLKSTTMVKDARCDTTVIKKYSEHLIRFPIMTDECEDSVAMIDVFTSDGFKQFVNQNRCSKDDDISEKLQSYRILKMSLQEIYCKIVTNGTIDQESWKLFYSILNEFVATWQMQQASIELKKQEEDSLYVNKTFCDEPTEEEQLEIDLKEQYPSYTDQDFSDFKIIDNTYTKISKSQIAKNKLNKEIQHFFTVNDVGMIASIHSNIVKSFTKAEWLPKLKVNKLSCDYITPLMERYKLFGTYLDNILNGLSESMNSETLSSLLVFTAYARGVVDGEDYLENNSNMINTGSSTPNFYLSPWVRETKKCLPTLELVKAKTLTLLEQWPDYPTLKDIIIVIDRILNFPVTSPIARFLTGFELLRDKIEEWNKNAHQGNNMIDLALVVAQHIVTWRKIELTGWKNSLNNSFERLEFEANKWWFHIYALLDCFIYEKPMSSNQNNVNAGSDIMSHLQFVSAIREFIEKSPLVEFNKRLDILFTFHCHAVNMAQSNRRDEAISILWNLHKYYSQYSDQIIKIIKSKRAPIEKKLKDFVKICTWDRDLSYWAVKELVHKTHKTLHKHVKEFEALLQTGVYNYLTLDSIVEQLSTSTGIWDRPKRTSTITTTSLHHYMVDPQNYTVGLRILKKYFNNENLSDDKEYEVFNITINLLGRIESLTSKAKNICKLTISKAAYPHLIQNLDGLTTQFIDNVHYLKSLDISPTLSKEKQKSLAKNQLQQKRKALSDLFRTLTRLGVSYKAGLMEFSLNKGDILNFKLPPIDLDSMLSYLDNKRSDTLLLSIWQGCEGYYQRCIAQISNLKVTLLSPNPQLGPENIERIKGCAVNMMVMIQNQKLKICKQSRNLSMLRHQITKVTEFCDLNKPHLEQSSLTLCLNRLSKIYSNIIVTMQQFDLLMKAYPTSCENDTDMSFDTILSDNPVFKITLKDPQWSKINDRVKKLINLANKQNDNVNSIKSNLPSIISLNKNKIDNQLLLCSPQIEIMKSSLTSLCDIKTEIMCLISDFNPNLSAEFSEFKSPIIKSIIYLNSCIKGVIEEITPLITDGINNQVECMNLVYRTSADEFVKQVEDLLSFVLVTMQEIFKKIVTDKDAIKSEEDDDDKDILENHLKGELLENLSQNVSSLRLSKLNRKINTLITKMNIVEDEEVNICRKQLIKCIPLLEQITLFSQYFFTQQVAAYRVSTKMLSIMLNTFVELTQKGFCTPADVEQEAGDGKGPGKLTGGMGLADGEGEKDVSDQIETQDQLDDARKPGEEKEDEKKDCKEEENGIDMTDDFQSHLQDVEKKDGSDEESDNDDVDKDMGETDNTADKLDQQIWGSDDEEEEENKDSKKEEKGGGESTGEKQMEAREDNASDDDAGDSNEKDKKEKNDINEMEEPEYDEDHIDPYHGNQKPQPETEPLDLPDDANIDENEKDNDEENNEENKDPFEISVMKDKVAQEEEEKDEKSHDKSQKDDNGEVNEDDSDDEDNVENNPEESEKKSEAAVDDENENNEDEDMKQDEENLETEELKEDDNDEAMPQVPDKKPEEPNESEQTHDEDKPEQEKSSNLDNKMSSEDNLDDASAESGSKDMVQTNPDIEKHEDAAPYEQSQEQDGDEQKGFGQSELSEKQKGHVGNKKDKPKSANENMSENEKQREKRNKPGDIDQDRVLGEIKEPVRKKMKTLNIQDKDKDNNEAEDEEEGVGENDDENDADLYQHIKQAKETDSQVIDAATKEQAEQQPVPSKPEDEDAQLPNPDDDIEMNISENEDVEEDQDNKVESEKFKKENKNKENKLGNKNDNGDEVPGDVGVEVEGENVETLGALRGTDTTFHTKLDKAQVSYGGFEKLNVDGSSIRQSLQSIGPDRSSSEDGAMWQMLWGKTSSQARLLTEKLRLVLEPTGLSRLAGDYRTGKRINMRRVIPYIASHFRKDRIWLRRTRPAKREYHIAVAIDDSSSMCDNQSKELAFESLALISQSLNLLEAGDLSVLSFGESPKIIHSFSDQFTEHSGHKLIQNLTFKQTKTKIAQMLEFASAMFEELCSASNAPNAKLLLIVSDGRGIFSEGETKVLQTIRKVRQHGVFIVYLIVDNPANHVSIMDIRMPKFDPVTNQLKDIKPYLDSFPFPFYLILRDITALPSVLSDAMRQWFELAANMDKH